MLKYFRTISHMRRSSYMGNSLKKKKKQRKDQIYAIGGCKN